VPLKVAEYEDPLEPPGKVCVEMARCADGVTVTIAAVTEPRTPKVVARTVTVCVSVTVGAERSPVSSTVPALADQKIWVWLEFSINAENCSLPPEGTLAF
jgi:hypothetical protein